MTDLFRATRARLKVVRKAPSIYGDRGSILPLVIGFWLIAMLFVAGSLALGTAFTRQRSLQSTCDAAALAAASGVSKDRLHFAGATSGDLPLDNARSALDAFVARDPARSTIHIDAPILDADHITVRVGCHTHTTVPFQTVILRAGGIDQSAQASAQSPID